MNAVHAFDNARPLAKHSEALMRSGPGPAELLQALDRAGERFASALRGALAPLLGGTLPAVSLEAPVQTDFAALAASVAPLAANSVLTTGAQNLPLLVSVEAGAVLSLVDRAFGGSGDVPAPLPSEFPLSAQLMATRIEQVVASALSAALGAEGDAVRPLRRDASLIRLAPFAPDTGLAELTLSVAEDARLPWRITLTMPLTTLASLFGHGDRAPVARNSGSSDPFTAPFADVPLPVRAVMAELDLPVSLVAALTVGQIMAIPAARVVPLRIDNRTIAYGTVGAVDDRVAIQVTRLA